jgi:cystathionine gamma-synthase
VDASVDSGGGTEEAGGHRPDPATGGVVPPIQPSTTFARDSSYETIGTHVYARYSNPGWDAVEETLRTLDGGADALVFASGMAAVVAFFETVRAGDHVVAPSVMYHGAQDWLRRLVETRRIDLTLFDAALPDGLAREVRPGRTAIVWIESPVNPTWDVVDIASAAEVAHAAGAVLAVDSTVAPPVTTRPLDLGADFVFHSATKYLNGHSDVLAGVLVAAGDDDRWTEVRQVRGLLGAALGPFEAWLLQRGLRTLGVRFERCSNTAMAVADRLSSHPMVEAVLYPGLASHPGHEIAARQMTGGFGGMLSILVRGGSAAARLVATSTRVFVPATSLGGVESLIEHRRAVEGPHSLVPDNLLRLSIGVEPAADLIADLEQALGRLAAS